MQDLRSENYKALSKEIKEETTKTELHHIHWLEDLMLRCKFFPV